MARANPFRFSTKYQDDETDLVYYGYRYYNASTGRWLSRDPIAELGDGNLYEFCRNNPADSYDELGLLTVHPYQYVYNASFSDPDILAETDPSVTQAGKTVGCGFLWLKSKLTGYKMDLYITIKYRQGVNPQGPEPGNKTRTIEAHEKIHIQNAIDYAAQVDKILSWLNEKCLCTPCFNAVMKYANKANDYYKNVSRYKDAKLDCDDYRPGSAAKQQRCQEANGYQGKLPGLQKELTDAYNAAKKECGWK